MDERVSWSIVCFNNDKPRYQEEAVRIRQLRGNMVKYEMLWGKTPIVLCNWNISGTKNTKHTDIFLSNMEGVYWNVISS
jgi:hypothetical protein